MNRYFLSLAMFGGLFFNSEASLFWGGICGNSNNSIKYTYGQEGNSVTWTEPRVDDKGFTTYVPIRQRIPGDFSPPDLVVDIEVTFERVTELEGRDESGCQTNSEEEKSWRSGWSDYLGKVTIVKKDGSSFPKGSRNLSQDGKTISAHLMCILWAISPRARSLSTRGLKQILGWIFLKKVRWDLANWRVERKIRSPNGPRPASFP